MAKQELRLEDTSSGIGIAEELIVTNCEKREDKVNLLKKPVVQILSETEDKLGTMQEGLDKESVKNVINELRRLISENLGF